MGIEGRLESGEVFERIEQHGGSKRGPEVQNRIIVFKIGLRCVFGERPKARRICRKITWPTSQME